jgi:hypothetical protein
MDLKVIIRSLDQSQAELKFEDGSVFAWPSVKLPKESKTGDHLTISIRDAGSDKEPEQLAKDLLNEILNTD